MFNFLRNCQTVLQSCCASGTSSEKPCILSWFCLPPASVSVAFLSLPSLSLCPSLWCHCCHFSSEDPCLLPDNCSWLPAGPFAFCFPSPITSWSLSWGKAGGGYSALMFSDVINALVTRGMYTLVWEHWFSFEWSRCDNQGKWHLTFEPGPE